MLRRATFAKVSAELLKIRQKDAATYTRCGSAATFQKFSTHNLSPLTLAQLSWRASRPRDRGVSAASRTWGGERWPGNDVALEMRRDGPAVQAADVPARPPRGPRAVVSQPDNPQGEKGCLKWKSTGGAAEQAYKHRARDALGLGGLAALRTSASFGVARRRGPRVRLDLMRPARPRYFPGAADLNTASPAPQRIGAAERWLFSNTEAR
jgi:hypothetical protein